MPGRKLNLDNGDALGQGSVDLFVINLAAPILYAHGAAHGDMEKAEAELELWKKLPAEKICMSANGNNRDLTVMTP